MATVTAGCGAATLHSDVETPELKRDIFASRRTIITRQVGRKQIVTSKRLPNQLKKEPPERMRLAAIA